VTQTNALSLSLLRDGKWKLHLKPRREKSVELYDLSVDPSKSQNLADQHPAVVAKLSARLKAWVAELPKKYEKDDKRKNGKKGKRKKRSVPQLERISNEQTAERNGGLRVSRAFTRNPVLVRVDPIKFRTIS